MIGDRFVPEPELLRDPAAEESGRMVKGALLNPVISKKTEDR
jgi:hypothetical protein